MDESDIRKMLGDREMISISAKQEYGIGKLSEAIRNMFYQGNLTFNNEVIITNLRHKDALAQALESLRLVEESISNQMPEDFYSIVLMHAYEALGYLTGESVEDDLADEIFSRFCMGK